MLATARVLRRMAINHEHFVIQYNPEDFAAAGGELLVLAMLVSWSLTYLFNPSIIESNALKDRVGYNNLCVGWDSAPARYVAAPIFAMIIFLYSRYSQLDHWRAQLDTSLSPFQKKAVTCANFFSAVSWFGSIGIFSIDAFVWPAGHTASFVQLVVFGYIAFLFNFLETHPKYHRRGSHVFCAFFGVICVMFGICAMTQMIAFDPVTKTRGPVPWQLMFFLDYAYFACMGMQGFMRPRAPSLSADYKLISDDDFKLAPESSPAAGAAPEVVGGAEIPL